MTTVIIEKETRRIASREEWLATRLGDELAQWRWSHAVTDK